ncbi:MAG: NAD-dependent epimerase/dehydratase family protein [Hyphomicrobiales bacterium]
MTEVLVVGGTGPSGAHIVRRFLDDGSRVTIFHSGGHEVEFGGDVEHLHGDAREPEGIAEALGNGRWDIAVCTSGRLRALASHLAGKVHRLVGITGQPVYDGTMKPTPHGTIPLPIPEDAPRQSTAANYTGKVAAGEDQLFEQHARGDFEAVVVRYPGVYGPNGYLAHEWAIVKRVVDGRRAMALPHGGITYFQRGYVENLASLVHLAATKPDAAGEAFNAGDERVLSARGVAEVILDELGAELELVDVPAELCRGSYPLAEKSSLVLSMAKARELLGYRDVVDVETATRLTARWLAENVAFGRQASPAFAGDLPYEREDQVLAAWRTVTAEARATLELSPGGTARGG